MSLKLETESVILNAANGYAPQVEHKLKEAEKFWSETDKMMQYPEKSKSGDWCRLKWTC